MAITIREVAALADVSIATVSRALRDHPSVSESTKRRVVDAAEQLGYTSPQKIASAPAVRRVALITPYVGRWFFGRVIEGIERVLHDRSMDMLLLRTEPGRRQIIPPDLHVRGISAVIVLCLEPDPQQLQPLLDRGIPVAVLGVDHSTLPHVRIDDVQAARMATRHLIELGHERIGIVTGNQFDTQPFRVWTDRRHGFQAELADAGVAFDPKLEVAADFSTRGAMRVVETLFDLPEPPTAIFAESDEMAMGVIIAARKRGIRVPEELSVVGFDDHELAEAWDLTTVAQPVDAQGELVAWQVISGLVGGINGNRRVVMPTSVVVRGTTRSRFPTASSLPMGPV